MTTWTPPPWPDEILTVTLTERQSKVLYGMCEGWSDLRIARELGLSIGQVKYAAKGLFKAMGSYDRTRCAVLAATGQAEVVIAPAVDRRVKPWVGRRLTA